MGQLLQGSARTTAAVRRAIQHSQESIATLAERYHLNPKTVAKWKKRTHVHDAPMANRVIILFTSVRNEADLIGSS
jgi:hypothetical protein